MESGKLCRALDGTALGWGAPEVVETMLRYNMGYHACGNGGRIHFTEQDWSYKKSNENDMLDPDSPCGRRLFYYY